MKVYLSYPPDTESLTTKLLEELKKHGIEIRSAKDLGPGEHWASKVEFELAAADAVVLMLGVDSGRTEWQGRELTAAAELFWSDPEKRVIPLLVGSAEAPAFLHDRRAIRLKRSGDNLEDALESLLELLQGKPLQKRGGTRTLTALRNQQQSRMETLQQEVGRLQPSDQDLSEEADLLRRRLEQQREANDPALGDTAARLGDVLKSLGQKEEALGALKTALESFRQQYGDKDDRIARAHANLAHMLENLTRIEESRAHMEKALAIYRETQGPKSFIASMTQLQLMPLLVKLGEKDHAAAMRAEALGNLKNLSLNFAENAMNKMPVFGSLLRSIFKRAASAKGKNDAQKEGEDA